MNRLTLLLVLSAAAAPLAGQAVLEEPKLDPTQIALRDALYTLRDTLTLVDAATSRIARDIGTTSDQVLRSRARIVAQRCAAAALAAPPVRSLVAEKGIPTPDRLKVRPQLDMALAALATEMQQCATEFTGLTAANKADELRGYGVGKGQRVRQGILRYQAAAGSFFQVALGIRYLPNTRNSGRSAGRAP